MMSNTGTFARQGTFDTAPADSITGNSIKRGDIEIPVVFSDSEKKNPSPKKNKNSEKNSKDSKSLNTVNKERSPEFANVPPSSTVKPQTTTTTTKQQTGSGKSGALNSVNNKLSKDSSSPQKAEPDYKPKQTQSNSVSKRLQNNTRRDSSPTKASEFSKSNQDSTKREHASLSNGSQVNHSDKSPPQVTDKTPGVKGDGSNNESKKKVDTDSVQKSEKHLRPRNRDFSPSRYEDVNVPTPRDALTRPDDKSHQLVGSNRQNEASRSSPAKRVSETRSKPDKNDMSRSEANRDGNLRDYGDSDRRESYEQIRLERDGLLRAEVTYKKRIRQLENEAKAFVKDINDLSDENKQLRDKLDDLEGKRSSQESDIRKENKDLLKRNEKFDRENQGLWTENQKLKREKSDLEGQVHRLTSDIETLQKTFTESDSKKSEELKGLKEMYNKLETENEKLKSVNVDTEKKLTELQAENRVLSESLSEKRREVEEMLKVIQNDNDLQNELKQSQAELDRVRKNHSGITRDLEQFKARFKELESEKTKLEENMKEKDNDIFSMKETIRKKKASNSDFLNQIENLKKEIEKLNSENAELRLLRKDISNLKEKVKSLNDELGKRNEGNKKLKREKSDNRTLIEDLKLQLANANAASASQVEEMNEKLDAEHAKNKKFKEEMDRKSTYISKLETETFEMNMKFDSLNEKMRELEREKKEWENKRDQIDEIEDSNKKLVEENRRLRQMLVERNIEVTNRQSEKTVLTSRLEKLERKQVDSDIKVKQLQGWMDAGNYKDTDPIVVVTTSALPEPIRVKPNRRTKKAPQKRMDQKTKAASLSLEDLRQAELRLPSPVTPPSLPAIDFKVHPVGYYGLYKQKLKLMRERRF